MPDSLAKTRVDSGNSTPDSSRNAQLQLLRAAAEAEYAFQSDDDEPGLYYCNILCFSNLTIWTLDLFERKRISTL